MQPILSAVTQTQDEKQGLVREREVHCTPQLQLETMRSACKWQTALYTSKVRDLLLLRVMEKKNRLAHYETVVGQIRTSDTLEAYYSSFHNKPD